MKFILPCVLTICATFLLYLPYHHEAAMSEQLPQLLVADEPLPLTLFNGYVAFTSGMAVILYLAALILAVRFHRTAGEVNATRPCTTHAEQPSTPA